MALKSVRRRLKEIHNYERNLHTHEILMLGKVPGVWEMSVMSEGQYRLVAAEGTGSALVEAMLAYKQIPYELISVDYENVVNGAHEIKKLNPLSELLILILPNGETLTESAAIALYLDEAHPVQARLGLALGHPSRAEYLRRLIFLVAPIYPISTYGDEPSDWVKTEGAWPELRKSTDEHRQSLWLQMEAQAGEGPYWFGEEFTAIDIYLQVMSHWRPRQAWFEQNAPRLWKIIRNASLLPNLVKVWTRNFPSVPT